MAMTSTSVVTVLAWWLASTGDVELGRAAQAEGESRDSIENDELVAAAHELRLSLHPPHQSLFRVVCILLYEDNSGGIRRVTGECFSASPRGPA